ncbi:polysaccharide deacetylase family protein [Streptomyces sp. NPDC002550]
MSGRPWRTAAVPLPAAVARRRAHRTGGHLAPRVRLLLFPRLAGTDRRRHVPLTLDNDLDPRSTPHILDALDDLGVRATFSVPGEHVVRHPALVRETARRGHELAVHGWTHHRP